MRARLVLALIAAGLTGCNTATAPAGARLAAVLSLQSDDPDFGGLSGLEISDDGSSFIAITDRARFVTGRLRRTDGMLVGVSDIQITEMRGSKPGPLPKGAADAEGLAQSPTGGLFVSFEAYQRVWAYPSISARPRNMPRHPDFAQMPGNGALEALAIAPDGALYTLPEHSGRRDWAIPLYRLDGATWNVVALLPRRGGFQPVGADFGPDGHLYLLERLFRAPIGFATRVRRFTMQNGRIQAEQSLFQTPVGRHGNLEGLSVWRDDAGKIRLTMVADDNFLPFQRGQMVEYILTD
ncbi:esterase-like activity of phytase family protein [Actibacterium ureilyticum]|uniref:esterase-like activity of phytase family protein n=1 Tax=Actibacterium ureilyticum TaxID=1590614 RepID=UPI000BAB1B2A|nr:esterase-like activity of phytase family protein [Actibacterium ureilyticum]